MKLWATKKKDHCNNYCGVELKPPRIYMSWLAH